MKIGFVSLGCPKNLVDSEVMMGLVERAGHRLTHDVDDAEVIVVNTCAFVDAAKQESVDAILEMAGAKRAGACRRLVVTGCLAERYRDELRREIPEIDVTLGTGEVPDIVAAVGGRDGGRDATSGVGVAPQPLRLYRRREQLDVPGSRPAPQYIYGAETPRRRTTPPHYAYVKLAEGCDYACSFCIIPTLRGPYRSRPASSIVDEARRLADEGVRELILISQDTTFYGIDRGERHALADLLRALNGIGGLEWIRLLYLYPTTITDRTLAAMAECDKVCRYIDLPLQHASDRVLRRMNRPGTRARYERLLEHVRHVLPDVVLRTTFIVGFPEETVEDVDELCGFVSAVEFDHVGVFTYSHEEGTKAYALADDVPDTEKRRRRGRVMELQQRVASRRARTRVGEELVVLVDGPSGEHPLVLQGRHRGQAPDIDPVVYLTDADPERHQAGMLVRARVTAAKGYDLVAAPLAGRAVA